MKINDSEASRQKQKFHNSIVKSQREKIMKVHRLLFNQNNQNNFKPPEEQFLELCNSGTKTSQEKAQEWARKMKRVLHRTETEERELLKLIDLLKSEICLMKLIAEAWLSYSLIYQPRDLYLLKEIEKKCQGLQEDQGWGQIIHDATRHTY